MRTQDEINLDSLQSKLKEAYLLAKFTDRPQIANLIENAFNLTRVIE